VDAAQPIDIAYGKVRLPVRAAGDLLAPGAAKPVADETRAVFDALQNPIGARPLREIAQPGERVAIVVNDITRLARADLLLPPIGGTLNAAGVPDRDMFIVFALGIHRRQAALDRRPPGLRARSRICAALPFSGGRARRPRRGARAPARNGRPGRASVIPYSGFTLPVQRKSIELPSL